MSGHILVEGVQTSGRHGVAPFEHERPTELLVDAELSLDLTKAAMSDDLAHTIDYTAVIGAIREVAEGTSFHLLERLGAEIADRLVAMGADRVRVRISKPAVAASLEASKVSVEIWRSRE